jgi:hypothetical protein
MTLVDTIENKDERTAQELAPIEVYVPNSHDPSSARQIPIRKGHRLDVDAVLARSLPTPGAYSTKDVKTVVLG